MRKTSTPAKPRKPRSRLERTLSLTRAGLVVERGARAFWPALSVAGACFAAQAFHLGEALPPGVARPAALVSGVALVAALGWGLWRFRWPTPRDAEARLDATLPGRPLTALADRMALGADDPAVAAIWARHIARMRAEADLARPVPPNPDLARRDPYALRLTALTAVAVAVLFGAPLALFAPLPPATGAGPAEAAMGPAWEGWAAPPRYTAKPGLYLNAVDGDTISVPKGTRFSFRFYGKPGTVPFDESLSNPAEDGKPADQAKPSTGVELREFVAVQDGLVTIGGRGGRSFHVTLLPDDAPKVALTATAERRADGKFVQPFHASDDYGVVSGHARVSLDLAAVTRRFGLKIDPEPRPDMVFDLPLPISGSRADFNERLTEDASKSAWANLPVKLTLDVEDGLGQSGQSGPQSIVLPGKRFFDPRAAALIEARQALLWNRANAPETAQILRAISDRPEDIFPDAQTGAAIRAVALRLEQPDVDPKARDDVAEVLWKLAVLLEDGGRSDALSKMQQAQQKLSEAMRNGASPDEIRKLMQDLKQATDDYLKMLAQQDPDQDPRFGENQPTQRITGDQIQQMMDAIQKLMEEGKMAEAQELLDQLARMMQNMKVTQGEGGEDNSPGGQSMRDLQETLRNQQQLSDDSFKDMQEGSGTSDDGEEPEGEGQSADGQSAEGQSGGQGTAAPSGSGEDNGQGAQGSAAGSPEITGTLPERQRQLREDLDRQRALMPHLDGEAGQRAQQSLDDAGRAMDDAQSALSQGDNSTAIDRQAEAIQSLRDGMKSLREALNEGRGATNQDRQDGAEGQQRTGDASGGQGNQQGRDPLGRATGEGAQAGTDRNMLQGDDVYGRAQELLDEIRRRSADRQRPQDELDYLGRLLDRF